MARKPSNFILEPVPHEEARAWIADKPVVAREVFEGLLPELRAKAFVVAGIEAQEVLRDIRQSFADIPSSERSWNEIREEVAGLVAPYLAEDAPEGAAVARAQLLMRTHGFQAYAVANERVLQSQVETFPFWQYLSLADGKVRPTHKALHGVVAPAGSPFWRDHTPPWDWGCRCRKVALLPEEVDEMREAEAGKDPEYHLVQEGANLQLLEQGRLNRGMSQQIDVRSPTAKGREAGFSFDPGVLIQPASELRRRYEEAGPEGMDAWREFEGWARGMEVADGVTVWQWMEGTVVPESLADVVAAPSAAVAATLSAVESEGVAAMAAAGGKGAVMYAGAKLAEARVLNGVLAEHLAAFPALSADLAFYGSHRGQIAWVKKTRQAEARAWAEGWVIKGGLSADEWEREVQRQVERYLKRQVMTSRNAIAWWLARQDGNRLVFNAKAFAADFLAMSKRGRSAGWFPSNIPDGRELEHIATHELGHGLDSLLGIRHLPEIRDLYRDQLATVTRAEAARVLSIYGASKVSEMIAEAWAEFRLAPSPRPLARRVGEIILAKYQSQSPRP